MAKCSFGEEMGFFQLTADSPSLSKVRAGWRAGTGAETAEECYSLAHY